MKDNDMNQNGEDGGAPRNRMGELRYQFNISFWLKIITELVLVLGFVYIALGKYFVQTPTFENHVRMNTETFNEINKKLDKLDPVVKYFERQTELDARELEARRMGRWKEK